MFDFQQPIPSPVNDDTVSYLIIEFVSATIKKFSNLFVVTNWVLSIATDVRYVFTLLDHVSDILLVPCTQNDEIRVYGTRE